MLNWENVDPSRSERAVRMLLRRKYPGLRSFDGSGGDGGRDAELVTPDGRTVFEAKSFGRLDTKRRRQVERSLQKAVQSAPNMTRWVLVIPMNRTPTRPGARSSEESWFEGRLQDFASDVDLDWWGLDWLDTEVALNQDIQRYIEGPDSQLLQRAAEFDKEQAVLAGGAEDLYARLERLKKRVDEVSPYWTLDFQVRDGIAGTVLRAKTADAAEVDPITITPTLSFRDDDPDDEQLRSKFESTMKFGGRVDLPAGRVTELHIEASEEARQLLPTGDPSTSEFTFATTREVLARRIRCNHQIRTADGQVVAQFPVYISERTQGAAGVTLYGSDPAGIASFEVMLPRPETSANSGKKEGVVAVGAAGLHFDLPETFVGFDIDSLLPVLRVLAAATEGAHVRFDLSGGGYVGGGPLKSTTFPVAPQTLQLVEDLHRMQKHTGSVLQFPANITAADVKDLRDFVRQLDGEHVEQSAGLTVYVRADSVDIFLSGLDEGSEGGLVAASDSVQLTVGDLTLPYGEVALWAPNPSLVNRDELEAIADGASAEGEQVAARFEPTDEPFVWLPHDQAVEYLRTGQDPTPED